MSSSWPLFLSIRSDAASSRCRFGLEHQSCSDIHRILYRPTEASTDARVLRRASKSTRVYTLVTPWARCHHYAFVSLRPVTVHTVTTLRGGQRVAGACTRRKVLETVDGLHSCNKHRYQNGHLSPIDNALACVLRVFVTSHKAHRAIPLGRRCAVVIYSEPTCSCTLQLRNSVQLATRPTTRVVEQV